MKDLAEKSDLHLKRKLWHILTGIGAVIITVLFHFDSYDAALAAFSIGFCGLIFELVRLRVPIVNNFFIGVAHEVLRERERSQISGFTYYCFGVSFTFFLYPFEIAMLAVFFLIFGDPIAALVGSLYGRKKIFPGKSVEGSLACFFVCALVSVLYLPFLGPTVPAIAFLLLGGISGMVAEMVTFFDDNLTLPLISGFLLTQGLTLLL